MSAVSVCEIFESIQGESSYAGLSCFFIRLAGCNLRCKYCDTVHSYESGKEMSIERIVADCMASGTQITEITGVDLTATEFKLLKYFMQHPGRLLTRDDLLKAVWGYEHEISTRTVDAHVKSLRKKIKNKHAEITTVIGMGYKFKDHNV